MPYDDEWDDLDDGWFSESEMEDIFRERENEMALIISSMMMGIAAITVSTSTRSVKGSPLPIDQNKAIVDAVMNRYSGYLGRGGTPCVESITRILPTGETVVSSQVKFVPWMKDMRERDSKAMYETIIRGRLEGKSQSEITQSISKYFENTPHKAALVAQTEGQKIMIDSRMTAYRELGVEYVKYVTMQDDKVRPHHALRDGKIYRIDQAPYMGEFGCRCELVAVEPSDMVEPCGELVVDEDELVRNELEND